MALFADFKEGKFGVGDTVRVVQKITEGGKARTSTFQGMVIKIKGRSPDVTFTVRRLGEAGVGIEKIYPLGLTTIEKIDVLKHGTQGVKHSKLYYVRGKSQKEIDIIYARNVKRKKVETAKKVVSDVAQKKSKK